MQRYNIISKLANLSISNLGKHKKIANLPIQPSHLSHSSHNRRCGSHSHLSHLSHLSHSSHNPLNLPFTLDIERIQDHRKITEETFKELYPIPHSLLSPPNPSSLPAKFFYLHLFHYFCTLNLKFDNSQIC